ncbi:MAG: DUF488 domain-containing protein [archaeon]|nr:DUF488 domain-containing protein [archaeon]
MVLESSSRDSIHGESNVSISTSGRENLPPKPDLLKAHRASIIDWPESVKRFKLQLKTSEESIAAMKEILELSKKTENITLLCYEKEGENCDRQIVKERLVSLLRRKKESR